MHDSDQPERRFTFCQQCGGTAPWARKDWVVETGQTYCCTYCRDNFIAFLRKMARKGKTLPL